MTLSEIISLTRGRLRDPHPGTYWSDNELIVMLNDTIDEFCRETLLLEDSLTPEICSIPVVEGQAYYELDSRIIFVARVYLAGYCPLGKVNRCDLDAWYERWEVDQDRPRAYISDLESQQIRLYPVPDDNYQLALTVFRIPLIPMTMKEPDRQPEINSRHHYSLIDGLVARAYQTNDSDTFEPNFYQLHAAKWRDYIEKIKQEMLRTRRTETICKPYAGNL
ncbi:MAG: hypothetical protein HQK97_04640 [Nitrospirae bacterium]|nr:hypothetical protein [Nitrospirota bacterium]